MQTETQLLHLEAVVTAGRAVRAMRKLIADTETRYARRLEYLREQAAQAEATYKSAVDTAFPEGVDRPSTATAGRVAS